MLNLIKELNLRYCPCSIELITKWNVFLIGTYELSEQADESINRRFGSLALICDNSKEIILEQNCTNGGVFDFRIVDDSEIDCKIDSNIKSTQDSVIRSSNDRSICVYSAHSNGNLSVYEIVQTNNEFKINEVISLSTGSSMLTCLDLIKIDKDLLAITGDSNSTLTVIKNQEIIKRIKINQFDYPIWSIKVLHNDFRSSSDQFLAFTGSDDCTLRSYEFKNNFQDHLQLLNEDSFEGGVTSIEILKVEQVETNPKDETNEIRDEINKISNYKLLVGSYDEKLRTFSLNDQKSSLIRLDETISIANAGVWRIKASSNFQLITGMYSGIHVIKNSKLIYTFNDLPINGQEVNKEAEHLIYGCCFSSNLDYLLITSFYKKKVYYLKLDEKLIELLKS